MSTFRTDPLLRTARAFLTVAIVLIGVAAAGLVLAMPALVAFRGDVLAHVGHHPIDLSGRTDVVIALLGIMAFALVLLVMGWRFLVILRRIVDSVDEGDPFAPVNAVRLRQMGWIVLAAQAVALPAAAIGAWLGHHIKDAHFGFGVSLSSLLLALVLFILARVFRRGAEMRAELEGTV